MPIKYNNIGKTIIFAGEQNHGRVYIIPIQYRMIITSENQ